MGHRLLVEQLLRTPGSDPLFAGESVLRLLRDIVGASVLAHRRIRCARPATEAEHRDLVEETKAVLSLRLAEPLGLGEIATAVHSSPFHLARVFRARTGSSLHAYRNQLRLRASLETLADPRRPIAGVALELGYASSSHFIDSFRAAFAMSPSAYRKGRRLA